MYAAVGYGSVSVGQVLFKLIDYYKREQPVKAFELKAMTGGRNPGGVLINGQSGLLVRFAGCCSPVPGDEIVGFTSRGRGVVVHRADCPNMRQHRERLLPASWQRESGAKQRYNANIAIRATDQGAALAVLSFVVSELKLAITAVNGRIDRNHDAVLEASISISDVAEVDMLIKKLCADKRIYELAVLFHELRAVLYLVDVRNTEFIQNFYYFRKLYGRGETTVALNIDVTVTLFYNIGRKGNRALLVLDIRQAVLIVKQTVDDV
jgi:(p)ppGpp synthase/HD superfamily hydrolase